MNNPFDFGYDPDYDCAYDPAGVHSQILPGRMFIIRVVHMQTVQRPRVCSAVNCTVHSNKRSINQSIKLI